MTIFRINPDKIFNAALGALLVFSLTMVSAAPAAAIRTVNDNTIVNAVEEELLFDPAVPSFRVRVTCTEGIVTLTGTVDSLLAKARAVDVTETVKGVRAVINKMQVAPLSSYTDEDIRENIRRALVQNPATDAGEIRVAVSAGEVTLTGTVNSYVEKDLARIVASGVAGVTALTNRVTFTIDRSRPDKELQADISQGLRWDALVDHEMIQVKVKDGKVTLSGVVGSAAEKQRAVNKSWIPGIRDVNANGLNVEGWARDPALREHKYKRVADKDIQKAVARAVALDPRVRGRGVTAEVYGGVVVLKGEVNTLQAARSAAQDARNTVGVFMVKNHLKVRPPEMDLRDSQLESRINQALERDAYLNAYEITAVVRQGVARLYGKVRTRFEKARAEDVASTVPGVVVVDNSIRSRRVWRPFVYNPYVDDNSFKETYSWYTGMRTPPELGKSDSEIRSSIKDELWWSPFVNADQVRVNVDDGRAILTGTVDSRMEVNAAVENALEGGALSVDNELTISSRGNG